MSSLLEEAIVDAEALKDAAIKNAESFILEKYSSDIKEAVTSLLSEQEEELGMMPPGPEDPLSAPPPLPMEGVTAATADDGIPEVPPAEGLMPVPDVEPDDENDHGLSSPVELTNVAASLNEELTIDFESLEREILLEQDNQIEFEIPEELSATILEEDVELDEDLLQGLLEDLEVDIHPQKSGWIERPIANIDLAVAQAEAAESSDEDEDEEENANIVNRLNETFETLNAENDELHAGLVNSTEENNKLKRIVVTLKEKLEQVNLSNAKLLYTNRILATDSLNERQKNKVVETLANANSVKEAKVIFETLQSTVGASSKSRKPESLSEVVRRGSSQTVLHARDQETPDLGAFKRMKALAGIK